LQPHECWGVGEVILYPMFHTLMSITMPDKARVMEWDLQRVCFNYHIILEQGTSFFIREDEEFITSVDYEIVISELDKYLEKLDTSKSKLDITFDIETKHSCMIDCLGITDQAGKGICIPIAGENTPSIWTVDEEVEITYRFLKILQHPNANLIAQNGSYDCQFFYKLYLVDLRLGDDTLILNHLLYNYLPKSLDFLASLFAMKYKYWKSMQNHGGKIS